ncbi:unnamed protein product, partial [Pylaiella littoralis]
MCHDHQHYLYYNALLLVVGLPNTPPSPQREKEGWHRQAHTTDGQRLARLFLCDMCRKAFQEEGSPQLFRGFTTPRIYLPNCILGFQSIRDGLGFFFWFPSADSPPLGGGGSGQINRSRGQNKIILFLPKNYQNKPLIIDRQSVCERARPPTCQTACCMYTDAEYNKILRLIL